MGKKCPTCNSEMQPVGAGRCPTCGQDSDAIRALFAAPQVGVGSTAGPAQHGDPAVAAILSTIPTREDGVTCHIEDVRKALLTARSERTTFSGDQIIAWAERHHMTGTLTDLRAAFDDARSL